MGIRKLECVTCGGKIDGATLTCQSCGMQYMIDDNFELKVLNSQLKWVTIDGMVAVPGYILDGIGRETASEMILTNMAKSMATKLLPFMEFRSMMNPCDATIRTHGRIRVAEPVVNRFGNTYMEMPRIDWRFMDAN